MILNVNIDASTHKRLLQLSSELGRSMEDLAEAAIAEAALDAFRGRMKDPAKPAGGAARKHPAYPRLH